MPDKKEPDKRRDAEQTGCVRRKGKNTLLFLAAVLLLAGAATACRAGGSGTESASGADRSGPGAPITAAEPEPSAPGAPPGEGPNGPLQRPDTPISMPLRGYVEPIFTCCNRLYYHVANTNEEMALTGVAETAYGFNGERVSRELLSETGELSQRVYLRNGNWREDDPADILPLYWVFDYVCDLDLEVEERISYVRTETRTVFGRYGVDVRNCFDVCPDPDGNRLPRRLYPGELLQSGKIGVYECLTDGRARVTDLYFLWLDPVLSDYPDVWPDRSIYGSYWLLAGPDREAPCRGWELLPS